MENVFLNYFFLALQKYLLKSKLKNKNHMEESVPRIDDPYHLAIFLFEQYT